VTRSFSRLLAALVMSISATLVVSVGTASAHSEPVDVSPAACTVVDSVDQIVVNLSAEANVDGTLVTASVDGTVISSAGVDLSDIDHQRVVLDLPAGLSGRVEVQWSTLSAADGDEAAGAYAFGIGDGFDPTNCDNSSGDSSSSSSVPLVVLGAGSVLVMMALVHNIRHRVSSTA